MSIRVVARIRPQQKNELGKDVIVSAHQKHDQNGRPDVVKIPNPKNEGESFAFQFSSVYDSQATQQDIFDNEVSPTVKSLFNGLDVTIFAYGSTGTGKTHTMRGGKTLADRGIIPRLLSGIYRRARKVEKDADGRTKVEITLSYYEIYNDKVFDLLDAPEKRPPNGLPIRDNGGKTVVVGLTERPCGTLKEFETIYDQANINRSTGATKLNATSSRSHAILGIKVAITTDEFVKLSTVSAIDLAGSEDNRRTGNGKERMVESAAINRSLFTLAKCVEAISQNQSRIPYRESKMTRILSLGQNNGLTIMILNLAPTRSYHLDTLSSLNFANRTKKIEIREIENEPVFKGCARELPSLTGETMKRQPLRPLTNAAHNSIANTAHAVSTQNCKTKSFAVYSDRASALNTGRIAGTGNKSPHSSRLTDGAKAPNARPFQRRSAPRSSPVKQSSLSKQAIEEMIERKVADALATRTLERAQAPVEPEISQEVQRRLDLIERKIEDQSGTGREQGLTFLLCAKQHAVRGEDRSALKMYELAKEYFPNNSKLDQKIEKLRAKAEQMKPSVGCIPDVERSMCTKRVRKIDNEDEDYDEHQDTHDYGTAQDEGSDDSLSPPTKRKRRRKGGDTVLHSSWTEDTHLSPGTQRLLAIVTSKDVGRISQLRGVGAKRAITIVEASSADDALPIRNLAQLAQLRGVGVKMVENMRAGLQVADGD